MIFERNVHQNETAIPAFTSEGQIKGQVLRAHQGMLSVS